jgi:biopolymer transport protein ExbD
MLKIGSPVPQKHSRIEIIPLIDIMFFLLASFMMVSLQMSKTENVRVNLPKAQTGKQDFQPNLLNIAVDKAGKLYVEKKELDAGALLGVLTNRYRLDTNTPVFIAGDLETPHGMMVGIYDLVRKAGMQKVSFCVTPQAGGEATP